MESEGRIDSRKENEEENEEEEQTVEPLHLSQSDFLEVIQEYSIAYQIVNLAPRNKIEAIEYYSGELLKITLYHSEELAIIHLALAKIYFKIIKNITTDNVNTDNIEKKNGNGGKYDDQATAESKYETTEKCSRHLKNAILFFTLEDYPMVFATICIMTAQILRQQYLIITMNHHKNFFQKKLLNKNELIRKGIELLFESSAVFSRTKIHPLELAVTSIHSGFLRLLQIENQNISENESDIHREYAIINLEESLGQLDIASKKYNFLNQNNLNRPSSHMRSTNQINTNNNESNNGNMNNNSSNNINNHSSSSHSFYNSQQNKSDINNLPKHFIFILAGVNPRSLRALTHYLLGLAHHPRGGGTGTLSGIKLRKIKTR